MDDGEPGEAPEQLDPRSGGSKGRRLKVAAAGLVALVCLAAVVMAQSGELEPAVGASGNDTVSRPDRTTTSARRDPEAPSSSTTSTPTTTVAPEIDPVVAAPLTGLQTLKSSVDRPAIISKIDGSIPAMPPVGMELADVVLEVRIEDGLSRYIAVWHSRDPAVIGPHRSARTTDPDLIAMFGVPHFAYSGANNLVVEHLAGIPWKTDVAHGAIPEAYFRDENRPYPHNLFARPDVLRTRKGPAVYPRRLFHYRDVGDPPKGIPVSSFETAAGPTATFTWDPGLGGWRRFVHDREHVHANGQPVAPTNVVVVETPYGTSFADARSPEAHSVGVGRAWVFTDGHASGGTWARARNTDPWDLRDAAGAPLTLAPGSTWVVVAIGEPQITPAG